MACREGRRDGEQEVQWDRCDTEQGGWGSRWLASAHSPLPSTVFSPAEPTQLAFHKCDSVGLSPCPLIKGVTRGSCKY